MVELKLFRDELLSDELTAENQAIFSDVIMGFFTSSRADSVDLWIKQSGISKLYAGVNYSLDVIKEPFVSLTNEAGNKANLVKFRSSSRDSKTYDLYDTPREIEDLLRGGKEAYIAYNDTLLKLQYNRGVIATSLTEVSLPSEFWASALVEIGASDKKITLERTLNQDVIPTGLIDEVINFEIKFYYDEETATA